MIKKFSNRSGVITYCALDRFKAAKIFQVAFANPRACSVPHPWILEIIISCVGLSPRSCELTFRTQILMKSYYSPDSGLYKSITLPQAFTYRWQAWTRPLNQAARLIRFFFSFLWLLPPMWRHPSRSEGRTRGKKSTRRRLWLNCPHLSMLKAVFLILSYPIKGSMKQRQSSRWISHDVLIDPTLHRNPLSSFFFSFYHKLLNFIPYHPRENRQHLRPVLSSTVSLITFSLEYNNTLGIWEFVGNGTSWPPAKSFPFFLRKERTGIYVSKHKHHTF